MSRLFLKGYRSTTRIVSLIVASTFLTTSSIGMLPFQNNISATPINLAAPSPLEVLPTADFPTFESLLSPEELAELIKNAGAALDKAAKTIQPTSRPQDAAVAFINAVNPYQTETNIYALAEMIVDRLQELDFYSAKDRSGLIKSILSLLPSSPALASLLLLLIFCVGCSGLQFPPSIEKVFASYPDIEIAVNDGEKPDVRKLVSIATTATDELKRKVALDVLLHLVNLQANTDAAERDTEGTLRPIIDGLLVRIQVVNAQQAEPSADRRVQIIGIIGKDLAALGNQNLANELEKELLKLYFRESGSTVEEKEAAEKALKIGGRPLSIARLTAYLNELISGPSPDMGLIGRILTDIGQRVEAIIGGDKDQLVEANLLALNFLFTNDRFSRDAQTADDPVESAKLDRGKLLQALAMALSPKTIPVAVAALDKNDAYKERGLKALLIIGTPKQTSKGAPTHNFGDQATSVQAKVLSILTNSEVSDELRALAGQVLNLMSEERVVTELRTLLAGKDEAGLASATSVADVYLQGVFRNREKLKVSEDKKGPHGLLLVRLLGVTGVEASSLRKRVALALKVIEYPQAINDLLIARMQVQKLIEEENDQETVTSLGKEHTAINRALIALGHKGDYASFKDRAIDSSASANLRVAMVAAITDLLNGENAPSKSSVASDLAGLLDDSDHRSVRLAALGLFAKLSGIDVSETLSRSVIEKLGSEHKELRLAAWQVMRALGISLPASQLSARLGEIKNHDPDEQLLEMEFFIQGAESGSDAAQPELTALAKDSDVLDGVRDKAVEASLALRGPNAPKDWLEEQLEVARDGSDIKGVIELLIDKSGWNQQQRIFYSTFTGRSGSELSNHLEQNIPAVISHPSMVTILQFIFEERTTSPVDQVALALAMIRLEDHSKLTFLFEKLSSADFPQQAKSTLSASILAHLKRNETPVAFHQAVVAANPADINIVRGALTRLKDVPSNGAVTPLLALLNGTTHAEIAVLAAEAIAATETKTKEVLEAMDKKLGDEEMFPKSQATNSQQQFLLRLLGARMRLTPKSDEGGDIGRGDKATLDIWRSAKPLVEGYEDKIELGRLHAIRKLEETVDSLQGIAKDLAFIASERLRNGFVQIAGYRAHVERKFESADEKRNDLFSLGFGTSTENRVPLNLFEFEGEDSIALDALAEALVHEALEGDKENILRDYPSLRKEEDKNPEHFHAFIRNYVQAPAFPNSKLTERLRGIIASKLEENEKLDQLSLSSLLKEKKNEAVDVFAGKVLEMGESEWDVQEGFVAHFNEEGVSLSERVAAELIRPQDYTSPLLPVIVQVLKTDSVIVLDAAVLDKGDFPSEDLVSAVKAGKVLFFGEKNKRDFDQSAFVKNESELASKISSMESANKVVLMLTLDEMQAHFSKYGSREIGGKKSFVAPLNPSYSIPVHLALASELIRVNFDVTKLSEAASLLLALELDSMNVGIDEMNEILTGLSLIPSEIIRDGKKRLSEDLIGAALKRIAA